MLAYTLFLLIVRILQLAPVGDCPLAFAYYNTAHRIAPHRTASHRIASIRFSFSGILFCFQFFPPKSPTFVTHTYVLYCMQMPLGMQIKSTFIMKTSRSCGLSFSWPAIGGSKPLSSRKDQVGCRTAIARSGPFHVDRPAVDGVRGECSVSCTDMHSITRPITCAIKSNNTQ